MKVHGAQAVHRARTGSTVGASAKGGPAGTVGHSTQVVALVQPSHDVGGGGAGGLGVHELDCGHAAHGFGDLADAGVQQARQLGGCVGDEAGQGGAPHAAEDEAGIGQVGVGLFHVGAGVDQQLRGPLHRGNAIGVDRGIEAGVAAGHRQ